VDRAYPAIPQSRPSYDLSGRKSIKYSQGKERTTVSVVSVGGDGGHAIEMRVDSDMCRGASGNGGPRESYLR
jgi:hypothetical protein